MTKAEELRKITITNTPPIEDIISTIYIILKQEAEKGFSSINLDIDYCKGKVYDVESKLKEDGFYVKGFDEISIFISWE